MRTVGMNYGPRWCSGQQPGVLWGERSHSLLTDREHRRRWALALVTEITIGGGTHDEGPGARRGAVPGTGDLDVAGPVSRCRPCDVLYSRRPGPPLQRAVSALGGLLEWPDGAD